jgi:iron(III) transport system permease protein
MTAVKARASRGASHGILLAGAFAISLLVALPLIAIAVIALRADGSIWQHLFATVLPGYIQRTLIVMTGVGLLTAAIGALTAWLVSQHEFPFRRQLQWALLLPLAMPLYITSYAYVAFLNYSGPLQTALRSVFGWERPTDYAFPEIRSLTGAIIVFALVLYPYVFLTAQAGFARQSASQFDAARTLGQSYPGAFLRVALPQARPAIMVGVGLALMECLNDIAAANFFGVRTLTLGIYTTWLGEGNLGGAAQLAAVLLIFVFAVLWLERSALRRQFNHSPLRGSEARRRTKLQGGRAALAILACALPIVLGFALPAAILAAAAIDEQARVTPDFLSAAWHSVMLALAASIVIVALGLLLAYAHRAMPRRGQWLFRLGTMGYAVPGTILGIGVIVPLAFFDNWLDSFMRESFGVSTGLLLSGTVAALVFAYAVRFLAISFGAFETGLVKVTPSLTAASRTLGRTALQTVREIDLPMLRPAIIAAALLVFVDCMKELSATLMLRPFDFETLATLTFNLASLDQLADAAIPALAIVAVGLAPVILLSRHMRDPWLAG